MYCKVCGKDLNEKDKFCSNCGAKVPNEVSEGIGFVSDVVDFEKEECEDKSDAKGSLQAARHIDFDWDLDGFKPEREIAPGKADFNWSSVVDEKMKSTEKEEVTEDIFSEEDLYRGEPVAFDWGLGTTTRIDRTSIEKAEKQENVEVTEVAIDLEPVTDISELISEKDEPAEDSEQEKRRIDKFYTFNKKNEEFQALLDQEYERLRQRIHEENEAEEALASKYEKLEKARDSWENAEIEPEDLPESACEEVEPEYCENAEEKVKEETEAEVETEAGTEAGTEVAVEETKVNPLPATGFDIPFAAAEEGIVAIYQPISTTIVDARVEKDAPKPCKKKTKIKYSDIFELDDDIEEVSSSKKKPEKEKKAEVSALPESECVEKSSRGKKIVLDILIVILLIVVIMTSILVFAKDSAPARFIQNGIDKVVTMFAGGEEENSQTTPPDVTTAMSKVIETEMSKNKNIGEVREGTNLGFAHDDDYGIDGFVNSAAFADSVWFTDDAGNTINYGNVIVGEIISYYSKLVDFRNGNGKDVLDLVVPDSDFYTEIEKLSPAEKKGYAVKALEFGEIRTMGDNYYVLVQITEVADEGDSEKTSKKIIQLVPEDKAMRIANIKDI